MAKKNKKYVSPKVVKEFTPVLDVVTVEKWVGHDGTEFDTELEAKEHNREALIEKFIIGSFGLAIVHTMPEQERLLIHSISQRLGRHVEDLFDELYDNKLFPSGYGTRDDF
jgi:hypothetical protein